jgi:hypothetical protein
LLGAEFTRLLETGNTSLGAHRNVPEKNPKCYKLLQLVVTPRSYAPCP